MQKPGWKCAPRGGGAEPGGGLTRGQQDGPQETLDLARPPPRQGHSLCAVVGTEPTGYRGDTGNRNHRQLFRGDFCTKEEVARGRGQARREVLQGQRESQVQTWDMSPGLLVAKTAFLGFCLFLILYIPPPSVLYFNKCSGTRPVCLPRRL